MILPDSSAWIEYQRATESAVDHRLTMELAAAKPLATTSMVILEVMAGARDDKHAEDLRRLLARCTLITPEEPDDSLAAALLYRTCRSHGRTIRRLPDCLIAAIAIRSGLSVLHADADFDALAELTALKVAPLPT